MRTALVTGAAGAFGKATMAALRERGVAVAGLDLRPTPEVIACDITDQSAVTAAVGAAVERLGGLDLLVNCAGIGVPLDAGQPPDETARRILDVNLWGQWHVTAAALPALLRSRGRVIFVASGLAWANVPFAGGYAVSKRALTAYADALRIEYGSHLGVTTIYPGYVDTPIHAESDAAGVNVGALTRSEQVSDVVGAIMRVASARRPPRDRGTSRIGHLEVLAARHLPWLTDRVILRRLRAVARTGRYDGVPLAQPLLRRQEVVR